MAVRAERELPEDFAFGLRYFNEFLLRDEAWFQANEGKYVAILDIVMDVDNDPHQLAARVRSRFPGHVLYMPHVVRLSEAGKLLPKAKWMEDLPAHWLEGQQYFVEILRNDPEWMGRNFGKHIAIIGRQVVGEAETFQDLSRNVRGVYGYGAIFMPTVTEEYPEIVHFRTPRLLSRTDSI